MLLSTFFICISCLTIWSFFASDVLWHFGTALLHDPRLCLINAEHDHAVAFMKSSVHLIITWVATCSFQFIQSCLHVQIWQESDVIDVIPPWWLWSVIMTWVATCSFQFIQYDTIYLKNKESYLYFQIELVFLIFGVKIICHQVVFVSDLCTGRTPVPWVRHF